MATNQINVILVVVLLSYENFELIYLSFTSSFGNKGNIVIALMVVLSLEVIALCLEVIE